MWITTHVLYSTGINIIIFIYEHIIMTCLRSSGRSKSPHIYQSTSTSIYFSNNYFSFCVTSSVSSQCPNITLTVYLTSKLRIKTIIIVRNSLWFYYLYPRNNTCTCPFDYKSNLRSYTTTIVLSPTVVLSYCIDRISICRYINTVYSSIVCISI